MVTVQVCSIPPDNLHALPSVDNIKVVIGVENVITITFPEFIGLIVVKVHVNFICISMFPNKGLTPGLTTVITPGEGIKVLGVLTKLANAPVLLDQTYVVSLGNSFPLIYGIFPS